jgi:hypothetical protein
LSGVLAVLYQVSCGFFQSFSTNVHIGNHNLPQSFVLELPITANKTAPVDSASADYLKCRKHAVKGSRSVLNYYVQQFDRLSSWNISFTRIKILFPPVVFHLSVYINRAPS